MAKINKLILLFFSMVFYIPLHVTAAEDSLPSVVILSTGGTIASQYDEEKGGFVPALTGDELIQAVPELNDVAKIDVENVIQVGSSDMLPENWVEIATRVNEILESSDVSGVVITHGTDTLEETAYFLDLTVKSEKPVVLVGSQRASSVPDSDGPRNLLNAVRVAASPEAEGMGAMIVMNHQINSARNATKTHTYNVETFKDFEFGMLGTVDYMGEVKFYRAPLRAQKFDITPDTKFERVEIIPHFAGADPRTIEALLGQGDIGGLVIMGTGAGNVSKGMYEGIKKAREEGVPVVLSTSAHGGQVQPIYASEGRVISTQKLGSVLGDNLSPKKARILLMLAMKKTKEPEELQEIFYK